MKFVNKLVDITRLAISLMVILTKQRSNDNISYHQISGGAWLDFAEAILVTVLEASFCALLPQLTQLVFTSSTSLGSNPPSYTEVCRRLVINKLLVAVVGFEPTTKGL